MAFRATGFLKSMIIQPGRNNPSRSYVSSSTSQKVKQYVTSATNVAHSSGGSHHNRYSLTGEFAPIYVMGGMLLVAIAIAAHTAKQQLMHFPGVAITKKKRESISEADNPDQALASADKFLQKSFLRKVAHVQDHKRTLPDPTRRDPFIGTRKAENLKTVGVNPSRH